MARKENPIKVTLTKPTPEVLLVNQFGDPLLYGKKEHFAQPIKILGTVKTKGEGLKTDAIDESQKHEGLSKENADRSEKAVIRAEETKIEREIEVKDELRADPNSDPVRETEQITYTPLKTQREIAQDKMTKMGLDTDRKEIAEDKRIKRSERSYFEEASQPENIKSLIEKELQSDNVKVATQIIERISKERLDGKFKKQEASKQITDEDLQVLKKIAAKLGITENTQEKQVEEKRENAPKVKEEAKTIPQPKGENELKQELNDLEQRAQEIVKQLQEIESAKSKPAKEARKEASPKAEEKAPEVKLGNAIWRNKEYDAPVKITGYAGKGSDGRDYVRIEGSNAAIPLDEIVYPEAPKQPEKTSEGKKEETQIDEETRRKKEFQDAIEKLRTEMLEQVEKQRKEDAENFKKQLEDAKKIAKDEGRKEALREAEAKIKEAEGKGKETGKKEGQDIFWAELTKKRGFWWNFKNLFKHHEKDPKDMMKKIEKYRRDIIRTHILGYGAGALTALAGTAIAQYFFGQFMIPWVNKIPELNGNRVDWK